MNHTSHARSESTSESARFDGGAAALWASAAVVLAAIFSGISGMRAQNAAHAGTVSEVGDLTVLTASGGDNDEILAVLDRRAEQVFVYGVEAGRTVTLYQVLNLQDLFLQARASGGGKR